MKHKWADISLVAGTIVIIVDITIIVFNDAKSFKFYPLVRRYDKMQTKKLKKTDVKYFLDAAISGLFV